MEPASRPSGIKSETYEQFIGASSVKKLPVVEAATQISGIAANILCDEIQETREAEGLREEGQQIDLSDWSLIEATENELSEYRKIAEIAKQKLAPPAISAKKGGPFAKKFSKEEEAFLEGLEVILRQEQEDLAKRRRKEHEAEEKRVAAIMQGRLTPSPGIPSSPGQTAQLRNENVEPIEGPGKLPDATNVNRYPSSQKAIIFDEEYIKNSLIVIDEIAGNISQGLFGKFVQPRVEIQQDDLKSLPNLLRKFATFVLNLGNLAEKNYALLFIQSIDNKPREGDKKEDLAENVMKRDFTWMLKWMTNNEFIDENNLKEYQEKLTQNIKDELTHPDSKILTADEKKHIVSSIVWIFSSIKNKTFRDHFAGLSEDEVVHVKKTCLAIMKLLIDKKIQLYCDHLDALVNKRLCTLIQTTMRDHVIRPLVKYDATHIMDTIRHLDWKDLIDVIVYHLYDHTNAYIAARDAVEQWDNTNQSRKKAFISLTTYEDPSLRNSLSDVIKQEIEKNLPALINQRKEYEKLKQKQFWKAFAEYQLVAHPVIKKYCLDDFKADQDAAAKEESGTTAFFRQLTNQLLDILFSDEMCMYHFWLKHLSVPNEISNLYSRALKLAKEIGSPNVIGPLSEGLQSTTMKAVVNGIIDASIHDVKLRLSNIVTSQLKIVMDQYTDPDELRELIADIILPEILMPKLIQIATQKYVVFQNIDVYAPLFLEAINNEAKLIALYAKLYTETDKLFKTSKFADLKITPDTFKVIVQSFMGSIIGRLKQVRDEKTRTTPFDVNRVKELMLLYQNEVRVIDRKQQYGLLIKNLLMKISKLKNSTTLSRTQSAISGWNVIAWGARKVGKDWQSFDMDNFLETTMSDIFVDAIHDARNSPSFTVNFIMEKLQLIFSKDNIDTNIFPKSSIETDPSSIKKPESKASLRTNLNKLENELNQIDSSETAAITAKKAEIEQNQLKINEKKYQRNLRIVTNLIYDIAIRAVWLKTGDLAFPVVKQIAPVISNAENFYDLISDLAEEVIFKDHRFNKSFAYQAIELVSKSLHRKSLLLRPSDKAEKQSSIALPIVLPIREGPQLPPQKNISHKRNKSL